MQKQIAKELKSIAKSLSAIVKLLDVAEPEKEKTAPLEIFDESPLEDTPKVDRTAVRKALSELSKAGKAPQVRELLKQFGVVKLSEIPDEKLGELLEKSEGL